MENYFEINISLNGKHYFATAPRSGRYEDETKALYETFLEKFPPEQGYEITVTSWQAAGHPLTGRHWCQAMSRKRKPGALRRANAEEKRAYLAQDRKPVYGLYGYVNVQVMGGDVIPIPVEDLRAYGGGGDPTYEIIAPFRMHFAYDETHTLLCISQQDVRERAGYAELTACEPGCSCGWDQEK